MSANTATVAESVKTLSTQELVTQYAPLVKRIAHHLLGRLPKSVQLEDLIQAGMIGLLEAGKNYDPSRGASFETYAGIRIRGNMLDEVRKNDWVPRSVYRNVRRMSEAVRTVENHHGRDAKGHEIAQCMGVSLAEYHSMLRDYSVAQMYGYEDSGVNEDSMEKGYNKNIAGPYEHVKRDAFHRALTEAIDKLPERERLVLALYYDEELNLKEIGQVLEISESRVCQIHSQAMLRVQSRVIDWKPKSLAE